MITNGCVKELRRLLGLGRTLGDSARMAEMSEKTARKYRDDDRLPSQQSSDRTYRTRSDPFAEVWGKVEQRLELEPRLKAKTLFEWLQQTHEGQFPDSTRRTFERRVTAYAEHIAMWSPPLKQFLEYQPQDAPDQPLLIHYREQFSETPLEFTEAVYRKDWRWIARSNDPRSVPLLKLYVKQAEDQYQGNVLTFRGDVVATLIESDLPEVQSILEELLSGADWPELYLVQLFIDRQLARGVSRQKIADWLAQLDMEASDRHLVPLLLKVGGDDFAKTAEAISFNVLQNALNETRSRNLQPGVRKWLISEWHAAPRGDLMMLLIRFSSPDIVEAMQNTDLSTTERALSLVSVLNQSGPGTVERTAMSEAAAKALAAASDQEHVSAVADVLRHLHTEIGLKALLAYDGPENKDINRARSEVQQYVDGEKERLEANLKLARELVQGSKTPDDLVETQAFVWNDGHYEAVED